MPWQMTQARPSAKNGEEEEEEEYFPTAAENKTNTQVAIKDWMLGPPQPTNRPKDNGPYWSKLAAAWGVEQAAARRQRCSNCEYYDNSVEAQEKMDSIPWNAWDVNAGFRGYCTKLRFVCHDLRSCQAWEEREDEDE